MIYLDNSATTPLAPEVRTAMEPYFAEEFGNASSVYTLGSRARVALEEAREVIANAIGAAPREIVFTASGTEANNAAIKGPLFHRVFSGTAWSAMSLLTSPAEHHAVIHPAEFLAKLGVKLEMAAVDATGHVIPESVAALASPDVALGSFMLVNNEVGAINDIPRLAALLHERAPEALVHTDAVQAFGKMPVNVRELGVDLMTLSAHKIHGPKGIGALYVRSGIQWEPLHHGGAQERNRRGGTESVALAVGFAEAVKLLNLSASTEHFRMLREYLLRGLAEFPNIRLNSATDSTSVDAIVNFSFTPEVLETLDADALLIRFDLEGIAISNGSACTSGSLQPSHVLLAMERGKEVATKSIRVSFSRYTTVSEVDAFLAALRSIIPQA